MYFQLERFGYCVEYEGSGGRLNMGLSMLCLVKIKMGLACELAAVLSGCCRLEHLHSRLTLIIQMKLPINGEEKQQIPK